MAKGDLNKGQNDLHNRVTNIVCSQIEEWGLTVVDVVGVLHSVAYDVLTASDKAAEGEEDGQ